MYLFFDTETTGICNFKAPHTDPSQPHIVQLAAMLVDPVGNVRGSMNAIIDPHVEIPEAAANVHGLTTEIVQRYGIRPLDALRMFYTFMKRADLLVAHNINFDRKLLRTTFHRLGAHEQLAAFERCRTFCTMEAMTPVCRLPGHRGYKWPKLAEAYRHLFDEELEGAHDAMIDVMGCKDVFFAYKAMEVHGEA